MVNEGDGKILGFFGRSRVVFGKTAGVIARHSRETGSRIIRIPVVVVTKMFGAVAGVGDSIRIRRLNCRIERWKKRRMLSFKLAGKRVFSLLHSKTRDIKGQKEVVGLFQEGKHCEEEMERLEDLIEDIRKAGEERASFRDAVLNLDANGRDRRFASIQALEGFNDEKAIQVLVGKLQDPDPKVRAQAADSLHRMICRAVPT